MSSHLGNRLQDGLRSLCDITENMQIGSIHVLSTGQQNCDLQIEEQYLRFIRIQALTALSNNMTAPGELTCWVVPSC